MDTLYIEIFLYVCINFKTLKHEKKSILSSFYRYWIDQL